MEIELMSINVVDQRSVIYGSKKQEGVTTFEKQAVDIYWRYNTKPSHDFICVI
jgi:hypothetical protein